MKYTASESESYFVRAPVYVINTNDLQAQIQATDELMVEQRHVLGPVSSWLSSFVEWAADSTAYR